MPTGEVVIRLAVAVFARLAIDFDAASVPAFNRRMVWMVSLAHGSSVFSVGKGQNTT